MNNDLFRKTLVCGIILLFVGTNISLQTKSAGLDKEPTLSHPRSSQTLYVGGSGPGNYSTIQSAINAAHNGDTVFVYHKIVPYTEILSISVSINLIGENKETTVIQGIYYSGNTISIYANSVNLSGFTIRNIDQGHYAVIINSNNNKIAENIISNAYSGIVIESGSGNSILQNEFTNNYVYDISLDGSLNTTIIGNDLSGSRSGLSMTNSNGSVVANNTILSGGLLLEHSSFNIISFNSLSSSGGIDFYSGSSWNRCSNNTITDTSGIYVRESFNNTFSQNTLLRNTYGVELDDAGNTLIQNNNLTSNSGGIHVVRCSNTTISGNSILYSREAIVIAQDDYTTILDNTIDNSTQTGISIQSATYCTISRNVVRSNTITAGVRLDYSSYVTITDNSFQMSGIDVNPWSTDDWSSLTVYNNTVNDQPLLFLKDRRDMTIETAGQLILVNCTNITAHHLNFINTFDGVILIYSSWNTIEDNTFTEIPSLGLLLFSSDNNTIIGNTITNCPNNVYFVSSSNNIVQDNVIASSEAAESLGIILDMCSNTRAIRNTFINTGSLGVSGWNNTLSDNILLGVGIGILINGDSLTQWTSHTIENNTLNNKLIRFYKNTENVVIPKNTAGVILANCSNVTIQGCNLTYIDVGYSSYNYISMNTIISCSLQACSHTTLTENIINVSGNDFAGYTLLGSSDNIISKNILSNTNGILYSSGSSRNIFSENRILNNYGWGMCLSDASCDNILFNNTIVDNRKGICISDDSINNTIVQNTIKNNRLSGVWLQSNSNANITHNMITNSEQGIYSRRCSNIIIIQNMIYNSSEVGILLDEGSTTCTIVHNQFLNNSIGISLFETNNNNITNNTIRNTSGTGIYVQQECEGNVISLNNITNTDRGITCYLTHTNALLKNTISYANRGIYLSQQFSGLDVIENTIQHTTYGIYLGDYGDGNHIYHNNFLNNQYHAYYYGESYYSNSWDNGYPSGGNYWDDYTGVDHFSGPAQDQPGSDGIGDTPYYIPDNNWDTYPLIDPYVVQNHPPYIPSDPQPPNGTVNVSINKTLYWTGGDPDGIDTVTYDVYFGTTNPPLQISSNQTETTFDPGLLLEGTRYYWKVIAWDNHGASTSGSLWTFTTNKNLPPFIPTEPSPADDALNISTDADLLWTGGDPNQGDTITYDVYFGISNPPSKLVSNQTATLYDPGIMTFTTTYYWQIIAWDNNGASTPGPLWNFTTKPNSPPNTPSNPSPSDGTIDAPLTIYLIWTGGDPDPGDTVTYDVYFDITNPPSKKVSNQTGTFYDPGTMQLVTMYYWRIVSWDNHGASTPGPVWSFTTTLSGYIRAWGYNEYSQCNVPEPNTDFIVVSTCEYHSLGLKTDGSIIAWGAGQSGQSGWPHYGQCIVPSPNTDFIAIAAGGYHSLGLKADGSVVAWGDNSYGQCDVPEPNTNFIAISAHDFHSLGLKADGSIVVWGANWYGECNVPEPNTDFIAIAAGGYHSLGLKSDGSVIAWGYNYYGQCDVPEPNTDFIAIAAGLYHNLGLKADGSIIAWGVNWCDQCNVPAPNTDFIAVATGACYSLGLKADGSIVVWGDNEYGQCDVPEPNTDFIAIAGGGGHSLGIKKEINNPPYTPKHPYPTNNSRNVPVNTLLSWTGGDPNFGDTVTYDVYFGVTNPPPKVSANQTNTTYNPETMNYSTLYYWKIISWDNHGVSTPGPVWQFWTIDNDMVPPNYQNQGQNRTFVAPGANISLYAQGRDDVALNWAWLATNETGEWKNFTEGMEKNWWNNDWQYRKQIIINHENVIDDLTNFPVLVSITSPDFTVHAQPDGDDFVFIDSTNTTKYYHEIDSYNNTTGELVAWVNVPLVSSTQDTMMYLYYGNPSCGNQQNVQGVWDTNYLMVHHLTGTSYSALHDSTTNHWDVTRAWRRPTYNVPGIIANAVSFYRPRKDSLRIEGFRLPTNSSYTASAWIYVNGSAVSARYILEGNNSRGIGMVVYADKKIKATANTNNGIRVASSTTIVDPVNPQWIYVCTRADTLANRLDVLVNGVSENHTALNGAIVSVDNGLNVGASYNNQSQMHGRIDELRVSNIPRTDAWINTEYTMMSSPSSFITVGSEETCVDLIKYGSPMKMQENNEWQWSNFTWRNSTIPNGTTVSWRIYYQDTIGKTNCTDIMSFYIGTQSPVIPPVLPIHSEPIHAHDYPNDLNKGIGKLPCFVQPPHGVIQTFSTTSTNTGQIYYKFFFGDAQDSGWLGPYTSGQVANTTHDYNAIGVFQVTAKAKVGTTESSSSLPLNVRMYKCGDINGDNLINFGDINPFVSILTNTKAVWYNQFPNGYWWTGDINSDCTINFGDINPFVQELTNCPP